MHTISLIISILIATTVQAQQNANRPLIGEQDIQNLTVDSDKVVMIRTVSGNADPEYVELLARANGCWDRGDARSAITFYERAVEHDSGLYPAHHNLGVAYAMADQFSLAVKPLEAAITLAPDSLIDQRLLGLVYYRLREYGNAVRCFERLLNLQKSPKSYNNLGYAYVGLGELEKAETVFKLALQKQPSLIDAVLGLCLVYVVNDETSSQAIPYCRNALDLDPHSSSANYLLASAYIELNRSEEAMPYIERALAGSPNVARIYLAKGYAEFKLNNLSEAFESFTRAAALAPRMPAAYEGKGAVSYRRGKFKEAMSSFQHAVELNPDSLNARFSLGLSCLAQRQRDCALEQYNVLKMSDSSLADSLFSQIFRGRILQVSPDQDTLVRKQP
jgi:tetratricopeptide (TPR) repeat protein